MFLSIVTLHFLNQWEHSHCAFTVATNERICGVHLTIPVKQGSGTFGEDAVADVQVKRGVLSSSLRQSDERSTSVADVIHHEVPTRTREHLHLEATQPSSDDIALLAAVVDRRT